MHQGKFERDRNAERASLNYPREERIYPGVSYRPSYEFMRPEDRAKRFIVEVEGRNGTRTVISATDTYDESLIDQVNWWDGRRNTFLVQQPTHALGKALSDLAVLHQSLDTHLDSVDANLTTAYLKAEQRLEDAMFTLNSASHLW